MYVQYILQTTLPPPFNLIPTASAIMSILEWITVAGKSHPHKRALCSITHCCYIVSTLEYVYNIEQVNIKVHC